MTQNRMTPERRAVVRHFATDSYAIELLAELDAVTRERDDFRAEMVKLATELGTALRERDEARKDTARLDWLQNDQGRAVYPGAVWGKPWACGERAYSELRNAIDDGMSWPSDSAASNEAGKPEVPKRCESVSEDGIRCGGIAGHDDMCHALIESALLQYPEWRYA